jgi:hypothetical protein
MRKQADVYGRWYQKKAQISAGSSQIAGRKRTLAEIDGHETW